MEKVKIKTPQERDNLDLLELVCQLHSRSFAYPAPEMHEAYLEAREELEKRLQPKEVEQNEWISQQEYENAVNHIGELEDRLKEAEDEIRELNREINSGGREW